MTRSRTNDHGSVQEQLYDAVKKRDLPKLRYLIDHTECDINAPNADGDPALHIAVILRDLNVIELLVKNSRCDINAPNREGQSPLHLAVFRENIDIVRILINSGCKVDIRQNGMTPLMFACVSGSLDIVRILVERGSDINARNERGHTPLTIITMTTDMEGSKFDIIRYLVERGSDINAQDITGYTALHWASGSKFLTREKIVPYLIHKGSNVNIQSENGKIPLHVACEQGNMDVVEYLVLHGSNITIRDALGRTPIDIGETYPAIQHFFNFYQVLNCVPIDKDLLKSTIQFQREHGNIALLLSLTYRISALHVGCSKGSLDIVDAVLNDYEPHNCLILNMKDINGNTPLHVACSRGHLDIVRILVERGSDINARNGNGDTPLHVACFRGHLDIVRFLVERGSDINALNGNGNTPLHLACKEEHLDIQLFFNTQFDLSQVLTMNTIRLRQAIQYALQTNNPMLLLSSDHNRKTALHLACINGRLDIVQSIVDILTTLNQKVGTVLKSEDIDLNTPLHLASEHGHLEVVLFLVNQGCSIRSFNKYRQTPLLLALNNGQSREFIVAVADIDMSTKITDNNYLVQIMKADSSTLYLKDKIEPIIERFDKKSLLDSLKTQLAESSVYNQIVKAQLDLILSNPTYVQATRRHQEKRRQDELTRMAKQQAALKQRQDKILAKQKQDELKRLKKQAVDKRRMDEKAMKLLLEEQRKRRAAQDSIIDRLRKSKKFNIEMINDLLSITTIEDLIEVCAFIKHREMQNIDSLSGTTRQIDQLNVLRTDIDRLKTQLRDAVWDQSRKDICENWLEELEEAIRLKISVIEIVHRHSNDITSKRSSIQELPILKEEEQNTLKRKYIVFSNNEQSDGNELFFLLHCLTLPEDQYIMTLLCTKMPVATDVLKILKKNRFVNVENMIRLFANLFTYENFSQLSHLRELISAFYHKSKKPKDISSEYDLFLMTQVLVKTDKAFEEFKLDEEAYRSFYSTSCTVKDKKTITLPMIESDLERFEPVTVSPLSESERISISYGYTMDIERMDTLLHTIYPSFVEKIRKMHPDEQDVRERKELETTLILLYSHRITTVKTDCFGLISDSSDSTVIKKSHQNFVELLDYIERELLKYKSKKSIGVYLYLLNQYRELYDRELPKLMKYKGEGYRLYLSHPVKESHLRYTYDRLCKEFYEKQSQSLQYQLPILESMDISTRGVVDI